MDAELDQVPQRRECQGCIGGESMWGEMSRAVHEATSGNNYEEVFVLSLQFISELIQPFSYLVIGSARETAWGCCGCWQCQCLVRPDPPTSRDKGRQSSALSES